jgi:hypothetical protein
LSNAYASKKINEEKNANIKFESGPASAEIAKSFFGFLKFLGFIGTGFAQPNLKNTIQSAPIGSRCFIGFIVSLPINFAVSSPSLLAASACENS